MYAFKFAGVFKRRAEIANLACADNSRELRRQNQTNVRVCAWRMASLAGTLSRGRTPAVSFAAASPPLDKLFGA